MRDLNITTFFRRRWRGCFLLGDPGIGRCAGIDEALVRTPVLKRASSNFEVIARKR